DQLLWNRRILAGTRYGVAPFVAAEQLGQQFCAQPPTVACRPVDVQPRYHPLTYRSQAAVARTLASSRSLSAAASPPKMQGDLGAECVQRGAHQPGGSVRMVARSPTVDGRAQLLHPRGQPVVTVAPGQPAEGGGKPGQAVQ